MANCHDQEMIYVDLKAGKRNKIVPVDKDIASLIQKFNDKGFQTEYCCSGHEEDTYIFMYIQFVCMNDDKTSKLIDILRTNSKICVNTMHIYEHKNGSRIQLRNPTTYQMEMAESVMKLYGAEHEYTHRRKIIARYFRHNEEINIDNLERNKREVKEIFESLMDVLDGVKEEKE